MEKALEIQHEVQKILGTDEVYLVGGSVRDLVMGNTPKDYDHPKDINCSHTGQTKEKGVK